MADYSELFKEELKYHAELEKSIDEKYINVIQLEVEILELKKQIDRTVKKGVIRQWKSQESLSQWNQITKV